MNRQFPERACGLRREFRTRPCRNVVDFPYRPSAPLQFVVNLHQLDDSIAAAASRIEIADVSVSMKAKSKRRCDSRLMSA